MKAWSLILIVSGALLVSSPALAYGRNATSNTNEPNSSALGSGISQNWSGYVADTGNNYTAVGATWNVPAPSNASTRGVSTDATWVGIGGVKSNDLIQSGTQAVIEDGSISYQAWYELLPDYQQIIPLNVRGGDSVTVNLTEIGTNLWHLSFKDNTTGGDYEQNITYASSLSSAEWIEEMPVEESGPVLQYLPLDNFGTVNFTGGYTVDNGTRDTIQAAAAQPLTMGSPGQALATPSSLLADDSFSVTRSSAQSVQPDTQEVAYTGGMGRGFRHRGSNGGGYSTASQSTGAGGISVNQETDSSGNPVIVITIP